MSYLPGIFSLLIAAAGWYYLFYSTSATVLRSIEGTRRNRRRVLFRRTGGAAMLLLAIAFYAGFETFDPKTSPKMFIAAWSAVAVLLFFVLILGVADLQMTLKIKKERDDADE